MAKRSCSREPDRDRLRPGLVVLKSLGKNAQSERFCFRHGSVGSGSTGENAGDFGKPAPVFFAFVFNCKFHVSPRRSDAFYARSGFATQREGRWPRTIQPVLQLPVVIDREWRVVAEALRFVDRSLLRIGRDSRRSNLIVDAPADVLGPGLASV